ncbi:hypothetical protein KJ972_05440, partial [Candidatus Micrarchaeota archaeon]|nr:hypothetical protein [Candidatus Micrarchaeota archaeon]
MPQKKSFSELGITDTESKVLESLVMDGPATGSKIAGRLGLHKSVTYFVLEQLTQKGLASFVVINKKRQYRPIDSETLITKLQERKKEFLQNFENTVASIQTVKQKRKSPSFNIFEGWEGMKTALHDIHKTLKAKEDYFVFAVDVPEKIFPRFRRFIRKFH